MLIVWSGSEEFSSFVGYLNNNDLIMEVTANFGGDRKLFLDVKMSVEGGHLVTSGYRKPTATNPLLHFQSYDPPHVKRSLPHGQNVRLRRLNK